MVLCRNQIVPSSLLIFLFSVVLVVNSAWFADSHGIKFDLIHRHDLERNFHARGRLDRLNRLIDSDVIRLKTIAHKLRLNRRRVLEHRTDRPDCSNGGGNNGQTLSGEMPMNSAADYGSGQYLVQFQVGSPPQKFALIADTGSDLTWMNCNYRCRGRTCRRNRRRIFQADRSSSFRTLPCSSHLCKVDLAGLFSLARCPSPASPCAYDYRYSDGSNAVGLYAHETVTFSLSDGRTTRIQNVLVGCTQAARGQSFQGADGVIGLGYSNYSLAVAAAARFGGKFSYCLVDHLSPRNISSYLVFGSYEETSVPVNRMRYTKLILGAIPPFYTVNLRGISVGDSMLDIPSETWNLNGVGGVILDSGSSLTALTLPAYQPVMAALKRSLRGYRALNLDMGLLEYCFNSTGFEESNVQPLVFHFGDGARFQPRVKSYVIDAADGVKCLGFVSAAWPGASVIGNIMQQNYFWEFDIGNGRLGFGPSWCT